MSSPLIVGNWKMNGGPAACVGLARRVVSAFAQEPSAADIVIAPPFTALTAVKSAIEGSTIRLAAQNCHWQDSGAFTGEISPAMLAEIGCDFIIIGHSERRQLCGESDLIIAQKLAAAIRHGIRPILCVGETLDQRQANQTDAVLIRQVTSALKEISGDVIEKLEIAYEPVWAIGTGLNATEGQIRQAHERIYEQMNSMFGAAKGQKLRILYGGSVKPDNAATIAEITVVSGLLVGGASLDADSFSAIARAFSL